MADQPPADLRTRIAEAIRPQMLIGLQDAELYDEPGTERINEWADSIADWAASVVQPELDRLRIGALDREALLADARDALKAAGQTEAHGDDWPAIAAAITALAAERDRLRAELAAARCACYPHPADHEDHCPRAAAPTATTRPETTAMEPLIIRWDRLVSHPKKSSEDTIVCCLTEDGQPVALLLDDELREALGLVLVDPNPED
jgi:hypothetical protein